MMKNLKHIFLAAFLVVGASLTASAQKKDEKKPPPDKKPPIIVVEPKKPKDDKPKDGKRPGAMTFINNEELSLG